jgi:hypothetical protein
MRKIENLISLIDKKEPRGVSKKSHRSKKKEKLSGNMRLQKKKSHSKQSLGKVKPIKEDDLMDIDNESQNYADEEYTSCENKLKTTEASGSEEEITPKKNSLFLNKKKKNNLKRNSQERTRVLNPILKFLENKRKISFELKFD